MIGNLRFEAMYLPGGIPGGIQLNKMRSQTAFSRTAYILVVEMDRNLQVATRNTRFPLVLLDFLLDANPGLYQQFVPVYTMRSCSSTTF